MDTVARDKARKAALRARQAMHACATELVACIRELEEAADENTPVKSPSQMLAQVTESVSKADDILKGRR